MKGEFVNITVGTGLVWSSLIKKKRIIFKVWLKVSQHIFYDIEVKTILVYTLFDSGNGFQSVIPF
jgi:hypothetical protein